MKFLNKKSIIALSTAAGALAASAAGYAVSNVGTWTSPQGSGSGSATSWSAVASVPSNSTTAPGGVYATALYPGGTGVTGVVSITNPNPYPIMITAIDNNGGSAAIGSCAAGTVSATNNDGSTSAPLTQSGTTATSIGANSSANYDVVYTMSSAADNSCQGQTFVVGLHVSAASANF